jgi:PQQ-dependent catabolism-associated beta-propeller protein
MIAHRARSMFVSAFFIAAGVRTSPRAGFVFVSNEASHSISVIDAETNRVIATVAVPSRPRGIQATRDGRFVFVALSEDTLVRGSKRRDAIAVIDAIGRTMVRQLRSGTDPEQFAITPDGSTLYASNEDAGTASAIDVRTGSISATAVVGIEPEGVAVSPDGKWVYVTGETSNSVTVIDAHTRAVIANLLVDARPRSVAFSPDSRWAYVSAEIGGSVTMIDTKTREIVATQSLDGGESKPVGVVVSPDGGRVYVACGRSDAVAVLNAHTLLPLAKIPVGRRPWGVTLSTDGGTLYVANGLSNTVSVIDTRTSRGTATVGVGVKPWGVAFVRPP